MFWDRPHFERHDGLLDSSAAKRLQQAYVVYPPSNGYPEMRSINMPVGNAIDYARIFGGIIVRVA